jgi:hypothetical protein
VEKQSVLAPFEAMFASIRSTNGDLSQLESYIEAGSRQTTKQGREYGYYFAYVNTNSEFGVTKLKSASFMEASYPSHD